MHAAEKRKRLSDSGMRQTIAIVAGKLLLIIVRGSGDWIASSNLSRY
ncbi:hypothetical protein CES85_0695 [Ochrobactrum quorumnocens]|jgi:hypothetical protein|uniref:Uncharacterized protein n=1 Tax=Ochrobactrum quorumnocens TaxID=271865 RepID=A0A248UJV2_9HYPH|nr:hypothetical protein CES85_0695 [[Ochrobactrum] quorumnocens]MDH7791931.1 hypothetical protein [Ochrobactrum sp. AN78]